VMARGTGAFVQAVQSVSKAGNFEIYR
jgi:hypothetical protein